MALYNYRVKKRDEDDLMEGLVEADSESMAVDILEEKGYFVLYLEPKKRGFASLKLTLGGVSAKDLVIFSRQLSILISAGVAVVDALQDVVAQTKNVKLKKAILKVSSEVEGGVKFSEALSHYPKVFDSFFINIIKSGEVSGRLQEVLIYLADQLEKDYDLKSKIKGALIYPAFVVGSLVVIGVLVMMFVVPKLTDMLTQTGAELPFTTRMLMGLSDFFLGFWWLVLIFLVGFGVAGYFIVKSPRGRAIIDNIKLHLPVFGKMFNSIAVIKFTRSLKTLSLGGVDLVQGLEITAEMVGNTVYRGLILETKEVVEGGGSIGEVFSNNKNVPKMLPQMLETGEDTGRIDDVLTKISEFYTREVNNLIANMMSLLEPFIMITLGVAVGLMITAVIMPMYEISTNM
jgi:type IV pilus assembly protein PilC